MPLAISTWSFGFDAFLILLIVFQGRYNYKDRPKRICPYCEQPQTQLVRHLLRHHKTVKEVVQAKQLRGRDRRLAFARIRRQGILTYNKKQLKVGNLQGVPTVLQHEKKAKTVTENSDLAMCSECIGFFSRKFIWKHKKECSEGSGSVPQTLNVNAISDPDPSEFNKEILSHLRKDAVGDLASTDPMILLIGRKLFDKSLKKERNGVSLQMRRLAKLLLYFRAEMGTNATGEEMLDRKNFDELSVAINEMAKIEDGKEKSGLKLAIGYLLKECCKIMKGTYIMNDKMDKVREVEFFVSVLELQWDYLFYRAHLHVKERREESLRRPQNLPLEADVQTLKNYIVEQLNVVCQPEDPYKKWDASDFVQARNLIITRLTLYNGRRGGEPARYIKL